MHDGMEIRRGVYIIVKANLIRNEDWMRGAPRYQFSLLLNRSLIRNEYWRRQVGQERNFHHLLIRA
jgi:hypothetical protein